MSERPAPRSFQHMNTTAQATLALADITPSTGPAFSVRDEKDYPVADLPAPPENRRPGGEFLDLIRGTNLVMPLVVIEVGGKFIVKDGLKRLWACLLTGRQTVDLKVVTVNSVRGAVLGLALNEARSENAIAEATRANLHAALRKAAGMLPRGDDTDGKVPLFESVDHALAVWDQTIWDIHV